MLGKHKRVIIKMKIALIGTHGTRKTTIAHELVAQLKKQKLNAEFLREVARMCPLPINENTTKEAQEWIIFSQYTKELEMKRNGEILLCDRSVLDGYVYYYNKFGENNLLESFVKEKSKSYDILFRVKLNESYLDYDGVRSINPKFQKDIDTGFDYLLEKLEITSQEYKDLNKASETIINHVRTRTI